MRENQKLPIQENQDSHCPPFRIFIADDHPLMRLGLNGLIDLHNDMLVCGEHERIDGLVEAICSAKPDALILDLGFPDGDGLDVLSEIRKSGNEMPILIVTSHDEKKLASKALRYGANGFVMKEEAPTRVIVGLRAILNGEIFLNETIQNALLSQMRGSSISGEKDGGGLFDELTDREKEIFECVGLGMSSKQIGSQLDISPSTVDVHKANIRSKLDLNSAPELLQMAIQHCASK